jgi:predicted methyltransferase
MSSQYPEDAKIELVEKEGEVTLYIDGGQAMQAWERELMWRSADILCAWGSEYLEVGLGLGLSALRIAGHDHTRRHIVVEKYQQVIDLFYQRHPEPPPNLQIVKADIFDFALTLEPDSLDGIFFDPYLSKDVPYDMQQLWGDVLPALVRSLRIGGAFVPYFSPQPELRWPYYYYFDRIIVERHSYATYRGTEYTPGEAGDAFIQCFVKTQ